MKKKEKEKGYLLNISTKLTKKKNSYKLNLQKKIGCEP